MQEEDCKKIRNIIQTHHHNKRYAAEDVYSIIEDIYKKFTELPDANKCLKIDNIIPFVYNYIHHVKTMDKYKFYIKTKNYKIHNIPALKDATSSLSEESISPKTKSNPSVDKASYISNEIYNIQKPIATDANFSQEPSDTMIHDDVSQSDTTDLINSRDKSSHWTVGINTSVHKEDTLSSFPEHCCKHFQNEVDLLSINNKIKDIHVTETICEITKMPNNTIDINNNKETKVSRSNYGNVKYRTNTHKYSNYYYPRELFYEPVCIKNQIFDSDWVHNKQIDDDITDDIKRRSEQCKKLKECLQQEQRTAEWYEQRKKRITASDLGCVLGINKHEPSYKFILKKTVGVPFEPNEFCYHGKKFEQTATIIYEYRMNCKVFEYGLIMHPIYTWIGASPDGICDDYKFDGKHLSNKVGRMLEIKCPFKREIQMSGPIYDHICPSYYWAQVQLQLEVCDLDECDFFQCKITEYSSRREYLEDTDPNEPFRSEETGFEKGLLIQLLPTNYADKIGTYTYHATTYDHAIFIHPPRVNMTPFELDIWLVENISNYKEKYPKYVFDRIVYWRLEKCKNVTILRDKEWFKLQLPIMEKMWNIVKFFQNNKYELSLLLDYIENSPKKINKNIMKIAETLSNTSNICYKDNIKKIKEEIDDMKKSLSLD